MNRNWMGGAGVLAAVAAIALAGGGSAASDTNKKPAAPPAKSARPAPTPAQVTAGKAAWADVYKVLQSPRCSNCHPPGDRPLQTDAQVPHKMNISRRSAANGLPCSTCHQTQNSEKIGVAGGPPGAPHWGLPPEETPMVFLGRSPRQLCEQFNDTKATGGRGLDALLEHVSKDPLILWAWDPGGKRTKPPLSHAVFVRAFETWVDGAGACP